MVIYSLNPNTSAYLQHCKGRCYNSDAKFCQQLDIYTQCGNKEYGNPTNDDYILQEVYQCGIRL